MSVQDKIKAQPHSNVRGARQINSGWNTGTMSSENIQGKLYKLLIMRDHNFPFDGFKK